MAPSSLCGSPSPRSFSLSNMDCDIDAFTSKMLTGWEWKSEDSAFGDEGDSLRSDSPESSFDSVCSSPETSSGSSGSSGSTGHHKGVGDARFGRAGRTQAPCAAQAQRHVKPKMSTKRRMKASEREKMRMRSLAEALHHLRDYLPPDYSKRGQPLTKIQTLKYTIEYINKLADILNRA